MTYLRSFRRWSSKHRDFRQHRYHCDHKSAQKDGSTSERTAAWNVRHPQQGRTPRSIRTHMSPQWCRNASEEHRGPPPYHHGTTWSRQEDMWLGQPPSNSPVGNPWSKCGRQNHHSVGTPSVHPPFLQRAQRDGTTSRLHTHLIGEQNIPLDHFLSGPSPRPHPCNSRPQKSGMLVTATHPSFLSGTGEHVAESDASPGLAHHEPGPALQGQIGRAPGSTHPCGRHDPGSLPQQLKLCADDRGLPRNGRSPLKSNGNMALPHLSLWASIRKSLRRTPSL